MFRALIVVACLALTVSGLQMQMNAKKMMRIPKILGASAIAFSLAAPGAMAVEGAGARLGIFSNNQASSPFTEGEKREDPIYSPYSPYGDGSKSVYNNGVKNNQDEIKLNQGIFAEAIKRVEKVPGYADKKRWFEITTELTRFTYSMRGSMLKLASVAKDPNAATAAAKVYFTDLNDIYQGAVKKNPARVSAAYEKATADLAKYKSLI